MAGVPSPEAGRRLSRVYPGAWRVLVVLDDGTGEMIGMTDPAAFEECERACLAFAWGVPFERRRVKRALIVPVAGAPDPMPGADFDVERVT
jgi:hypothetical protein